MKTKKIIFLLGFASCLFGCNFLELDETSGYRKEDIFSSFDRTKSIVTNVYSYLPTGFSSVSGTMEEAATDDAMNVWPTNGIRGFYDGSWSPINLNNDVWSNYYQGIRAANQFLESKQLEFPDIKDNENYVQLMEQYKYYPYEVRFLRAFFHFELMKRYGNIVIAKRTFSMTEVNSLEQSSFEDVVEFIVNECDEIASELPVSYKRVNGNETGRITRGAVMALKSRVLLYAASELHNPEHDDAKWMRAAEAAKELIDLSVKNSWYGLIDENVVNNIDAKGLILERRSDNSNGFESDNFPMGYEGGNTGVCPSQNLMEAFEMKDGTPFDWSNPDHVSKMYDKNERDPRMFKTILYNGASFKGKVIESYVGGMNGLPKNGATKTSYYLKKYLVEDISLTAGSTTTDRHVWVHFRLAEIYLNYAEALGEVKGATFVGTVGGVNYTLSAKDAVDAVRLRAGMPVLPTGLQKEEFINRVRNERRVELAFEGHRFWDIRRWKIGDKTTDIYGLDVIKNADNTFFYTKKIVQKRVWNNKYYYYPISNSELFKNHNLIQNPGWK